MVASFQKGANTLKGPEWVGLENYAYLLGGQGLWDVLAVTARFLIIIIPLQVVAALFLAILLNERIPGVALVRTTVFIPVAAPAAVAAVVWGIAYQPRGPINAVLEAIGLPAQPFLTDSDQALLAIIALMSWIGVGYWTLFIIAALQEVPRELYEAAAIDGAGWWRTLSHITLPSIRRTLAFVIVADTVSSVLAFVPVQVLTQGGPADSTRLIMYDLYNNTFQLGDANLGQTQVVILLVFLVIITAVQFRMLSREGE
ncbi:MAG: sugar ABC transporter permease [Schaalia hyovaginalis]|uniref:carbohydrate ABC transporter permease n=1 Tax=Schaalia hyovaginalis TaxID=29316 RepID=UPI0026EBE990|nr:sugar ABC transporter permease [Schaalia hyovaginalis]MCI7513017.1 sugar ABC transporter permease [Schaalia hyovaginalis]MDY5600435.1 sugar ABC transporter permease [Schaalia hyovaginalis]